MVTKTGTSGNDTLYGGAGGDRLVGLAGDDIYGVYSDVDVVVEQPGEGVDQVLTFATYALQAGASVEALSTAINAGTDPIALTGNELSQFVIGNYGNNVIDGAGGGDALIGLRGNDIYYVSSRNDFIVEYANEGNDTAYIRTDFILNAGSSVETIRPADPSGTTALVIGGNELAQAIYGNAGDNQINGGGGLDTLYGGNGNDTYRTFGGESVIESRFGGFDQVFTSGSLVLDPNSYVEVLSTATQAGTDPINLTGSLAAQVIIGNYGNNIIQGGSGDTLIGLRGDDVYRIGTNDVVIRESAGEGTDIVYTDGPFVLPQGVSVETLSSARHAGFDIVSLYGNELAQTVIGNYGANTLDGGGGNDTIYGLEGNDVFRFTTPLGAGNIDTLIDYGSGDIIRLDTAVFSGLAAGTLPSTAIAVGTAAADADDRIIYNPQTGALSFDPDGTGATAATQFATLPANLAASALTIEAGSYANPTGSVRITTGGTFLVGGATGDGLVLASAYSNASSFIFGNVNTGLSYPANIVFGPDSIAALARQPITFSEGFAVGTFDFSQLGTGLVLRTTTDFQTSAGQTIIAYPNFDERITFSPRPSTIIGTPFDDYIDDSLRPGQSTVTPTVRFGAYLQGGAGNDTLIGGGIEDGGTGNDLLVGDLSTVMIGGAGSDTFRIPVNTRTPGTNSGASPNTLVDYDPATDQIVIVRNVTAGGLELGQLDPSRFFVGSDATTLDQRIIYDPNTGQLKLDSNGSAGDPSSSGSSYGVFAILPAHLDLHASNFVVVGP